MQTIECIKPEDIPLPIGFFGWNNEQLKEYEKALNKEVMKALKRFYLPKMKFQHFSKPDSYKIVYYDGDKRFKKKADRVTVLTIDQGFVLPETVNIVARAHPGTPEHKSPRDKYNKRRGRIICMLRLKSALETACQSI